ncbi:hypothetical protein LJC36_00005, partial [Desulfovibrio sp. OttesenSCG-928-C14]|nr:hypothetical protein [Desulfovibrio sp. OttesenSCG-928-C14]
YRTALLSVEHAFGLSKHIKFYDLFPCYAISTMPPEATRYGKACQATPRNTVRKGSGAHGPSRRRQKNFSKKNKK